LTQTKNQTRGQDHKLLTKLLMDNNQEQQYQDELNQARAATPIDDEEGGTQAAQGAGTTEFPWGMFFIAAFFDLIGIIPILNLLTDFLASLLLWFWQKQYAPQTDPLLSIFANKIIDICTLGIFPSNIGIVVVAYIKKRASARETTGEAAAAKPEPSAA